MMPSRRTRSVNTEIRRNSSCASETHRASDGNSLVIRCHVRRASEIFPSFSAQPAILCKTRGTIPAAEQRFAAADTVEQCYQRYVEWLAGGVFDPAVAIFTPESRDLLRDRKSVV